jgi:hypothetical protein
VKGSLTSNQDGYEHFGSCAAGHVEILGYQSDDGGTLVGQVTSSMLDEGLKAD